MVTFNTRDGVGRSRGIEKHSMTDRQRTPAQGWESESKLFHNAATVVQPVLLNSLRELWCYSPHHELLMANFKRENSV